MLRGGCWCQKLHVFSDVVIDDGPKADGVDTFRVRSAKKSLVSPFVLNQITIGIKYNEIIVVGSKFINKDKIVGWF